MVRALLLAAVLTAASGCAVRAAPYRFAGPVVASVSLDDLAEHGVGRGDHAYDDGVGADGDTRIVDVPGAPGGAEVPGGLIPAGTAQGAIWRGELAIVDPASGEPSDVVIPRLTEPHRQDKVKDGVAILDVAAIEDVAALRALIGSRDGRGDVRFALDAAAALRGSGAVIADDGPALVELAADRGALATPADERAMPGDLLVFDRVDDGAPASLVAVAIGRDERGVIEMLYLANGVVRRGFVDPARPTIKRDDAGRVVNTFVRHGKGHPPKGTRYLAGELLASVIAWRDLTAP